MRKNFFEIRGRLLYKFLKKKCCLSQYIDNTLFYKNIQTRKSPKDIINFLAKNCDISYAFCWADTPQGQDYWEKLYDEFEHFSILEKKKIVKNE